MLFALAFVGTRIAQIITLIPVMGMLAWFVNGYNNANALTPNFVLVLFIVSVLALAWAIFTLFSYHRSSANARFVALIDLCFVGAFIAGIWYLRGIRNADCTNVTRDSNWTVHIGDVGVTGPGWNWNTDKPCAMLKASWAFAIMNCIFFFWTSIVAFAHGDRMSAYDERKSRHRGHSSRHGHRHRSHSDSHYSHRSRSGSHSHRRVYV